MTTLTDAEREMLLDALPPGERVRHVPTGPLMSAGERILAERLAQQREEIAAAILASSFFGHEAQGRWRSVPSRDEPCRTNRTSGAPVTAPSAEEFIAAAREGWPRTLDALEAAEERANAGVRVIGGLIAEREKAEADANRLRVHLDQQISEVQRLREGVKALAREQEMSRNPRQAIILALRDLLDGPQ